MHVHAGPASTPAPAEPRAVVAEILRRHGPAYLRDHAVTPAQGKALRAAMACRTAALGGHLDVCRDCGWSKPSYNSCRDRHCPTCQSSQAAAWLEGRVRRVLPTHYFHVVFTLPAPLRAVALANPRIVYDLLFDAASSTLLELGASRLGARLGITAVLHTWTREMLLHPHLHCVVTGGGLRLDDQGWVGCKGAFLFPVRVMGALFRGKFMDGLVRAQRKGTLHFVGSSAGLADPAAFARLRATLYATDWVVFAKRPFGGPEQVLRYLSRYTHRVAISDARILHASDDRVVIRTRGDRSASMRPAEFIRRLLLHVLPTQLRKIRHYGLLAPANVNTRLALARRALGGEARGEELPKDSPLTVAEEPMPVPRCPACGSDQLRREHVPVLPRGPP